MEADFILLVEDTLQSYNGGVEARRILADAKVTLTKLLESPFYKIYNDFLDREAGVRNGVLSRPLPNMDAVLAQEFLKGEVSAFITTQCYFKNLLDEIITTLGKDDDGH